MGDYLPDTSQKQMSQRRQVAKSRFAKVTQACLAQIKERLKARHSPEQIAGWLKYKGLPTVSHETIYQLIYRDSIGIIRGWEPLPVIAVKPTSNVRNGGEPRPNEASFPIEWGLNNDQR